MDGEKTLSNDTDVQFWGYGVENPISGQARIYLPGPILRFDLGDTVIIHLNNVSPEDHTIHWHGLDVDQDNDGVGHTSSYVWAGTDFTYQFVCTHAGTFLYHCHVLTPLHSAMGMYGLFIVDGAVENSLYNVSTKYTKDFSFLFSEMNTSWNIDPLNPGPFALYEADYVMVNGFADQELDSTENVVYGILEDTLGFRLANVGYGKVTVTFPTELDVVLVGSDGRELNNFTSVNELTLYPGERFEVLAHPNILFEGVMNVDYYDLRNNNLLGSNDINIVINSALDLHEEETEVQKLNLYPNPASAFVKVQFYGQAKNGVIKDLSGRLVSNFDLTGIETTVNINDLNSGVYILTIDGYSSKFIKE
jgi:FtsP/CotA-like multicopper oxidase with cupredoxin domain